MIYNESAWQGKTFDMVLIIKVSSFLKHFLVKALRMRSCGMKKSRWGDCMCIPMV